MGNSTSNKEEIMVTQIRHNSIKTALPNNSTNQNLATIDIAQEIPDKIEPDPTIDNNRDNKSKDSEKETSKDNNEKIDASENIEETSEISSKKPSFGKRVQNNLENINGKYDNFSETFGRIEDLGQKVGFEIPPLTEIGGSAAEAAASAPPVSAASAAGAPPASPPSSGPSADTAIGASSLASIIALGATIIVALYQINSTLQEQHNWRTNTTEEFMERLYSFEKYYRNLPSKSGVGQTTINQGPIYIMLNSSNVENKPTENNSILSTELMDKLNALEVQQNSMAHQLNGLLGNFDTLSDGLENLLGDLNATNSGIKQVSKQLNDSLGELRLSDLTCPSFTLHFPRDNQVNDYVRYKFDMPRLLEATVCMWVTPNNLDTMILFSYATRPHENAFNLRIQNATTIQLFMRNSRNDFTVPRLTASTRVHICVAFSTKQDKISLYINGIKQGSKHYAGSNIAAGGHLILGQDQDGFAVKNFDPAQAFRGIITNFMIWARMLTNDEITNVVELCHCPKDYVLALMLDRVRFYGNTLYSVPTTCPTL